MAIVMEWAQVAGRFRTNRYGKELVGENFKNGKVSFKLSSDDLVNDTKKFIEAELSKLRSK